MPPPSRNHRTITTMSHCSQAPKGAWIAPVPILLRSRAPCSALRRATGSPPLLSAVGGGKPPSSKPPPSGGPPGCGWGKPIRSFRPGSAGPYEGRPVAPPSLLPWPKGHGSLGTMASGLPGPMIPCLNRSLETVHMCSLGPGWHDPTVPATLHPSRSNPLYHWPHGPFDPLISMCSVCSDPFEQLTLFVILLNNRFLW